MGATLESWINKNRVMTKNNKQMEIKERRRKTKAMQNQSTKHQIMEIMQRNYRNQVIANNPVAKIIRTPIFLIKEIETIQVHQLILRKQVNRINKPSKQLKMLKKSRNNKILLSQDYVPRMERAKYFLIPALGNNKIEIKRSNRKKKSSNQRKPM